MTDEAHADHPQLSREELLALKFAAHRQLSRFANSPPQGARKQARRDALLAAVRVLDDDRLAAGCQLRPAANGGCGLATRRQVV